MKLLTTLLIAPMLMPPAPQAPAPERRALQFVYRQSTWDGGARELAIPLSEPIVTYRVRPLDGESLSFSAYGFGNDGLDALGAQLPLTWWHHPRPELAAWLAPSPRASSELAFADQAATQEDLYRLITVVGLVGGVLPIALVPAHSPQSGTAGLVSLSLFGVGLVAYWLAGDASRRSVDHLGRAVWRWNHGQ